MTEVTGTYVSKKRLQDGSMKSYVRKRAAFRRQMSLTFTLASDMRKFDSLLTRSKEIYNSEPLANVVIAALEKLLAENQAAAEIVQRVPSSTAVEEASNVPLVVCDKDALGSMLTSVEAHGRLCTQKLVLEKLTSWGFASRLHCSCDHHSLVLQSSSLVRLTRVVDCKLVLSYIGSGMLDQQFEKFCNFSSVPYSRRSKEKIIQQIGAAAQVVKEESIAAAQEEEVRATEQDDPLRPSISIETDARHACRKNSFHTDVVALGQRCHKVVGITHVTKEDETSSQKHEAAGTDQLYNFFAKKNIRILDHDHDRNTAVNKIIREKNGPSNSNDRWHAAKSIKKGMQTVASGPKKKMRGKHGTLNSPRSARP